MCYPLLVMLPYITAAAAAASAAAAAASAQQQSKIQNATYQTNANNARTAQENAYEQQGLANQQQYSQATQLATNNALAAARARATATVAAGDSGIAGASVDSLVNDITRQEGNNYQTIDTNRGWAVEQQELQGLGIQSQAASQINSAPRSYYNPAVGILSIGTAGVSGYASGSRLNAPAIGNGP